MEMQLVEAQPAALSDHCGEDADLRALATVIEGYAHVRCRCLHALPDTPQTKRMTGTVVVAELLLVIVAQQAVFASGNIRRR